MPTTGGFDGRGRDDPGPAQVWPLHSVFGISNRLPSNYVERAYVDGVFVRELAKNKHVVIYGCSKQGKTSLRKRHLPPDDIVTVQCTGRTRRETIYEMLLKEAGARTSVTETVTVTGTRKLGVTVGGAAKLFAVKAEGKAEHARAKQETREVAGAYFEIDPADPNDVVRVLREAGFRKRVVIEDFHYLPSDVQEAFAQDLRVFHEQSDDLRFIVIGVWLQPGFLTRLNGDLQGRISYVNADRWDDQELLQVLRIGEALLNITFSRTVSEKLLFFCQNNVGLLQEIAEHVCEQVGISRTQSTHLSIYDDGELGGYWAPDARPGGPDEFPVHLAVRGTAPSAPGVPANFHGGPIDKWLTALSRDRAFRYANFLRDLADGPREYTGNLYRWIAYAIVRASNQELKEGLVFERVYELANEAHARQGLGGEFQLPRPDVRVALLSVRPLHDELQVHPPILDFDASEDRIRVVDSGFLLYHAMHRVEEQLVAIGLDPVDRSRRPPT